MERIGLVIGMAITEKIGKGVSPRGHRLAISLGRPINQQAARPCLRYHHLEGIARGEGLLPLAHDLGHLGDRRVERKVYGPIGVFAAILDDPLKQRHMQAGDRGEGKLACLRHVEISLPRSNDRLLGLRPLRQMADDGIAGLVLEDAGAIVARAEMARRLRMQAFGIFEQVRGEDGEIHGQIRSLADHPPLRHGQECQMTPRRSNDKF